MFPTVRLRRLRYHPLMRDLVRETEISVNDIVYPLFVKQGKGIKSEITTMPGCYQFSVDMLNAEINEIRALGIKAVLLFGIPLHKDALGTNACSEEGIIAQALQTVKAQHPDLLLMTDVCFCEYTSHGHCGVWDNTHGHWDLNNDETLPLLAKQAVVHAQAGADVIAPSGMLDGMIKAIRGGLDKAGFYQTPIMSYSAKYASSLYGPFREAVNSTPSQGDRKSYQMDPANAEQALREVELDIAEGADIVMVKPATFYLDIIQRVKTCFPSLPLAAYCVGGEYAMVKAAARQGWLDEQAVFLEQFLSIKRAGADMVITYAGKQIAKSIR